MSFFRSSCCFFHSENPWTPAFIWARLLNLRVFFNVPRPNIKIIGFFDLRQARIIWNCEIVKIKIKTKNLWNGFRRTGRWQTQGTLLREGASRLRTRKPVILLKTSAFNLFFQRKAPPVFQSKTKAIIVRNCDLPSLNTFLWDTNKRWTRASDSWNCLWGGSSDPFFPDELVY